MSILNAYSRQGVLSPHAFRLAANREETKRTITVTLGATIPTSGADQKVADITAGVPLVDNQTDQLPAVPLDPCIGIAVPGRPLRVPGAEDRAPQASATDGTGLLRSALGPCRNGRVRASAVTSDHRWCGGTARRPPSGSCSWDDAGGRFGLWSLTSAIESLVTPLRSFRWPCPDLTGQRPRSRVP
jgi:hypothetical protein